MSSEATRHYVDLSHTIEDGMITYPGLPGPLICDYLSREQSRAHYAEGTEFQIGKIELVANTGTYLDSPFHRYADGIDLSELPLSSLADLDGVVVRADPAAGRAVTSAAFAGLELRGRAVLIHTGWYVHWGTEQYFQGHPFLTADAATFLREAGAALVGIDSLNIDDMDDKRRPVHSTLLGGGIPIIEHLRGLSQLPGAGSQAAGAPGSGFRFSAVPAKVKGCGTFPVRAYAVVDEASSH